MNVFLGLGSNEGDRLEHLEAACREVKALSDLKLSRISPLYETPALLPDFSPPEWNRPFLNLVLECEVKGTPQALLQELKRIEKKLGRVSQGRWSPRVLDIDILLWGDLALDTPELTLPHARLHERAFVLDPLKDLRPDFIREAKTHPQHAPLFMGVVNVTPDSFSQKTGFAGLLAFEEQLNLWDETFVPALDVGAESTRPGAIAVDADEEWRRLEPVLNFLQTRYAGKLIKPQISLDTRYYETAKRALSFGVDILNDVSGLRDERLLDLVRGTQIQYVLMHSLSVPADPATVLSSALDPVDEIQKWFEQKLERIESLGIRSEQIWIDPGIGFGKTASQSLEIMKNLARFRKLPYRLLVGHSRKSFFNSFVARPPGDRDLETLGLSLNLAGKGVDMLRVHDPLLHIRAFQAWNHAN